MMECFVFNNERIMITITRNNMFLLFWLLLKVLFKSWILYLITYKFFGCNWINLNSTKDDIIMQSSNNNISDMLCNVFAYLYYLQHTLINSDALMECWSIFQTPICNYETFFHLRKCTMNISQFTLPCMN